MNDALAYEWINEKKRKEGEKDNLLGRYVVVFYFAFCLSLVFFFSECC